MRREQANALLVGASLMLAVAYELVINVAGPVVLAFVIGQWTT